jgi:prepilin-type N-terminal cleavage/methylation domain-containing protein
LGTGRVITCMKNMMKNKFYKHKPFGNFAGFTLVEMLAVVLIIGILIAILVPVLAHLKTQSRAKLARLDCSTIAQAITQYNMDNIGRFPIQSGVPANTDGGDITFSMHKRPDERGVDDPGWQAGDPPHNAQLMIILSALEGMGINQVNPGHARNSKKFKYLDAKFTDNKKTGGMGPNGIFRDPFGNPYVVTIDKSGDDKCWDMLYGNPAVSCKNTNGPPNNWEMIGWNGLTKETIGKTTGYVLNGKVMVWSAGPDRRASGGKPANAVWKDDKVPYTWTVTEYNNVKTAQDAIDAAKGLGHQVIDKVRALNSEGNPTLHVTYSTLVEESGSNKDNIIGW